MLYCNGAVPPVPLAIMAPLFAPQVAPDTVAVMEGPCTVETVVVLLTIHPLASLT